eukprot:TRINITY_DN5968_c0_g2_i1.p1 TRINITY_DN5968_c0_g2~~TRINITY_DN5968_c0_g2_i1.p1  ORF type:complete len:117 (-),score=5.22 TRINITY_DN5968_c0_g2_i1:389-739(-)
MCSACAFSFNIGSIETPSTLSIADSASLPSSATPSALSSISPVGSATPSLVAPSSTLPVASPSVHSFNVPQEHLSWETARTTWHHGVVMVSKPWKLIYRFRKILIIFLAHPANTAG